MLSPTQIFELGKPRSGTAIFPLLNASKAIISVSTRSGNAIVDNGVISYNNWNPNKNIDFSTDGDTDVLRYSYSYSTRYTGNVRVKFLKGLKDVYSWRSSNSDLDVMWNITNLESFLSQFPNLYSIDITQQDYEMPGEKGIIKGDLAKIPNSVENVLVTYLDIVTPTDLYVNVSNFSTQSKLKRFQKTNGHLKIIGDLFNLPPNINLFEILLASEGSAITYTAGKVWASAFDTLYLPIPLTPTENDNLLIDAYNSIITAEGGKLFHLKGTRTAISDISVSGLIGKGYTVDCARKQAYIDATPNLILKIDFQKNYDTYGNSLIPIEQGNTNGLPIFGAGRKGTDYSAVFDGSKSIKTTTNLPIGTDKIGISFWIKPTIAGVTQMVFELSENAGANNAFYIDFGEAASGIVVKDANSVENIKQANTSLTTSTWNHVVVNIDRTQNANGDIAIYLNNVLQSLTTLYSSNNDINGIFGNYILYIGQRAGYSLGFTGNLQEIEIKSDIYSPAEISALYTA